MREIRTSEPVEGVLGNEHPYPDSLIHQPRGKRASGRRQAEARLALQGFRARSTVLVQSGLDWSSLRLRPSRKRPTMASAGGTR